MNILYPDLKNACVKRQFSDNNIFIIFKGGFIVEHLKGNPKFQGPKKKIDNENKEKFVALKKLSLSDDDSHLALRIDKKIYNLIKKAIYHLYYVNKCNSLGHSDICTKFFCRYKKCCKSNSGCIKLHKKKCKYYDIGDELLRIETTFDCQECKSQYNHSIECGIECTCKNAGDKCYRICEQKNRITYRNLCRNISDYYGFKYCDGNEKHSKTCKETVFNEVRKIILNLKK